MSTICPPVARTSSSGRDREHALRQPRRRVDQLVAEQVAVHVHRQGARESDRRHPADGVPGGLLHGVRIGATDAAARHLAEPPLVHPVDARGDHQQRAPVRGEDERLHDLADGDAERVGGLLRGPRVDLELDHLPVEAVLRHRRLHLLDRGLHRA